MIPAWLLRSRLLVFVNFYLVLATCAPSGPHKPVGSPVVSKPSQEVTFDEVKPVFKARCSRCHPAMSSPDWQDYNQALVLVKNGRLEMRALSENPTMPRPDSPEALAITRDERNLIRNWVRTEKAKLGGGVPTEPPGPTRLPDLVGQCVGCHGSHGLSAQDVIANLAGQKSVYLVGQLAAFKQGTRKDGVMSIMNGLAATLADSDIQRLADYFSKLDPQSGKTGQTVPVMDSARRAQFTEGQKLASGQCISCHLTEQGLATGDIPNLAYQKEAYLINQLKSFRSSVRKSEQMGGFMNALAAGLSDEQISAVAVYFSVLDRTPAPQVR